eukprot:CAMPEP_0176441742 /NCGR_PEP_ID=MMETSP0127-20121128/21392_1 /TAXON_ID=938130 /ORGANISM="Platyophrya macrostoma, Strain WH" /LENGTH=138 /DNA_ID=CAMNT_0017826605 /DNA_START=43 /DNA_END=455 /DNA_ORIENTATION=-
MSTHLPPRGRGLAFRGGAHAPHGEGEDTHHADPESAELVNPNRKEKEAVPQTALPTYEQARETERQRVFDKQNKPYGRGRGGFGRGRGGHHNDTEGYQGGERGGHRGGFGRGRGGQRNDDTEGYQGGERGGHRGGFGR